MKICECGCGIVIKDDKRFVSGHNGKLFSKEIIEKKNMSMRKTLKEKIYSNEERKKRSESKKGKNHHFFGKHLSDEHKRKIGKSNEGKVINEETRKKISETEKGKIVSKETRKKLSDAFRKEINEKDIIEHFKNVLRYEGRLLKTNIGKHHSFVSNSKIRKTCKEINKTLDQIALENNLKFDKRIIKWRQKEKLIEEVIEEYEGNIETQKNFPGIGRPDIITKDKVYEAKSYYYMGWSNQLNRYEQLNREVKFIVFEDKGQTDIPKEKTILIKEIVKKLPNDKKLLIQEKIERINNNIPLEQISLREIFSRAG